MKKSYRILLLAVVGGLLAWLVAPLFMKLVDGSHFNFLSSLFIPERASLFIFCFIPLGLLPSLLALSYGKIKSGFLNLLLSSIVIYVASNDSFYFLHNFCWFLFELTPTALLLLWFKKLLLIKFILFCQDFNFFSHNFIPVLVVAFTLLEVIR